MRIKSMRLNQVKLIAKDNLEGILLAILAKKIFQDRTDLELVSTFSKIEEELKDKNSQILEPVKSFLVAGLEIKDKNRLEETCRRKKIKFKHFIREYKNNISKYSGDYLNEFIESFKFYPKILKKVENLESLIEVILSDRDREKKFELIKLINILGKERFIERFVQDGTLEFSKDEQSLIVLESERLERELERLISTAIGFDLVGLKSRLIFSNPSFYSEYYLDEVLRRDSSLELAMIIELPESIKIKFRREENLEFQRELISRLRGEIEESSKIVEGKLKSFGVKKMIFEFMKFYGESRIKF